MESVPVVVPEVERINYVSSRQETGKEVLESYIFAVSDRVLSIYSERLLLCLVDIAQKQLLGASFKDGSSIGRIDVNPLNHVKVVIPVRDILNGPSNYSAAKEAVIELMNIHFSYERQKTKNGELVFDSDGNPVYEFYGAQFMNNVEVDVKPGMIELEVNRETWAAILDFSKGFKRYDLESARKLKLTCSLRLFKLLCNQKEPITFSIDHLRRMWGMDKKDPATGKYLMYDNVYDFLKHTVDPAQRELKEKATWGFSYVKNYSKFSPDNSGRSGRRRITSLTFFPIRYLRNYSEPMLINVTSSAKSELGTEVYVELKNKYGFTDDGLKHNISLWHLVKESGMDLISFLNFLTPSIETADNKQGFIVHAVRTHISEFYGLTVEDEAEQVKGKKAPSSEAEKSEPTLFE